MKTLNDLKKLQLEFELLFKTIEIQIFNEKPSTAITSLPEPLFVALYNLNSDLTNFLKQSSEDKKRKK